MSKGKHAFVAYIDESGHYHFSNNSDWFVLSAFIVDAETDLMLPARKSQILQRIHARNPQNFVRQNLHMTTMRNQENKLFAAKSVAEIPATCISILSHKRSLKPRLREKLSDGHAYYQYMARYLVQKISWYCSRQNQAKDGKVKIRGYTRSSAIMELIYDDNPLQINKKTAVKIA